MMASSGAVGLASFDRGELTTAVTQLGVIYAYFMHVFAVGKTVFQKWRAPQGYWASRLFNMRVDQMLQTLVARCSLLSTEFMTLLTRVSPEVRTQLPHFSALPDLIYAYRGPSMHGITWRVASFFWEEARARQAKGVDAVLFDQWVLARNPSDDSRGVADDVLRTSMSMRMDRVQLIAKLRVKFKAVVELYQASFVSLLGVSATLPKPTNTDEARSFFAHYPESHPGVVADARADLEAMIVYYATKPAVRGLIDYVRMARGAWSPEKRAAFPEFFTGDATEFVAAMRARKTWLRTHPRESESAMVEDVLTAHGEGTLSVDMQPGPGARGANFVWLYDDRDAAFRAAGGIVGTGADDADGWVMYNTDTDTDIHIYEDLRRTLRARFPVASATESFGRIAFEVRTLNGLPPMGIKRGLRPNPLAPCLLSVVEVGGGAEVRAYESGDMHLYAQPSRVALRVEWAGRVAAERIAAQPPQPRRSTGVDLILSTLERLNALDTDSDSDAPAPHQPTSVIALDSGSESDKPMTLANTRDIVNLMSDDEATDSCSDIPSIRVKRKRMNQASDTAVVSIDHTRNVEVDGYRGPFEPMTTLGHQFNLLANVAGRGGIVFLRQRGEDVTSDQCRCATPAQCGTDRCESHATYIECTADSDGQHPRFRSGVCANQRIQRRQFPVTDPVRLGKKGVGLVPAGDVQKGEFVIEYIGEVIGKVEYRRRVRKIVKDRGQSVYFMQRKDGAVIDAMFKGNCARFVNHSCNPNCTAESWYVNGRERVILVATKRIRGGEEITFDYNFERDANYADIPRTRCLCGTKPCCGYLGDLISTSDSESSTSSSSDSSSDHAPVKKRMRVAQGSSSSFAAAASSSLTRSNSGWKSRRPSASSSSGWKPRALTLSHRDPDPENDVHMSSSAFAGVVELSDSDEDTVDESGDVHLVLDRERVRYFQKRRTLIVPARDLRVEIVSRSKALHAIFQEMMGVGSQILTYVQQVRDPSTVRQWSHHMSAMLRRLQTESDRAFARLIDVLKQRTEDRRGVRAPRWEAVLVERIGARASVRNVLVILNKIRGMYASSTRDFQIELEKMLPALTSNISRAVTKINSFNGLANHFASKIGYLRRPAFQTQAHRIVADASRRRTRARLGVPDDENSNFLGGLDDVDGDVNMTGGCVSKHYVKAYLHRVDTF